MTHTFTNDELLMANYRLSLENNVMLKILLQNQAMIMQKLSIPIGINSALMATLLPKEYKPQNPNEGISEMMKLPEVIQQLVEHKISEDVFEIGRVKRKIEADGPDLGLNLEGTSEPIPKQ